MNSQQIFTTLAETKSQSGGTSLITYYLQGGMSLWLVVGKLTNELGTASNIKSRVVRKDVEQALRCALYQLKNYKSQTVPENGLVLCSGTIIENKYCL